MNQQPGIKKPMFLSLRWKLLIGFTLIFSGVFAGAFCWFYTFSTYKAISRLEEDLVNTAIGTAEGVDVPELLDLYQQGQRNAQGFSDDRRYQHQLDWFKTIQQVDPRVYPYSFIVGRPDENRRIGSPAAGDLEIIYLVDSLWLSEPQRSLKFLEPNTPYREAREAFEHKKTIIRDLYSDQWGSWLSAYTPLLDQKGKVVAILGVDIKADYVRSLQNTIKSRMISAFAITYGTLFILVFLVSGVLTKPLNQLTDAATSIGEGDYNQDLSTINQGKVPDEISTLAKVFQTMVDKVRQREESLKRQVIELKIEIDQSKRQKQVSEIVDTDFFQDLVTKARKLRSRNEAISDPQVSDPQVPNQEIWNVSSDLLPQENSID
jgi:HAMP domain-containing protein